jgi:hypothetical protein
VGGVQREYIRADLELLAKVFPIFRIDFLVFCVQFVDAFLVKRVSLAIHVVQKQFAHPQEQGPLSFPPDIETISFPIENVYLSMLKKIF